MRCFWPVSHVPDCVPYQAPSTNVACIQHLSHWLEFAQQFPWPSFAHINIRMQQLEFQRLKLYLGVVTEKNYSQWGPSVHVRHRSDESNSRKSAFETSVQTEKDRKKGHEKWPAYQISQVALGAPDRNCVSTRHCIIKYWISRVGGNHVLPKSPMWVATLDKRRMKLIKSINLMLGNE